MLTGKDFRRDRLETELTKQNRFGFLDLGERPGLESSPYEWQLKLQIAM